MTGKQPSPGTQKNTNITPGLNCLQGDPRLKESLQSIWFFFPTPFCGSIFYTRLKGKNKKKKQRRRKLALNEKFQSCLCQNPPSPSQCPSPLIQVSVFPGKGVRKLLKNILLLYWDWHLTGLCSVLTWVNLNDKLGFIRQGSSVTIEQHDCFVVEGKRGRIKVFFKSPVVPLTCQKVVTHSG